MGRRDATLIFVGLQFTNPAHTNPTVDEKKKLHAMTEVPSDVSAALIRSCNDCHSNQTNWRWYTYVEPVSWFTVGHVNYGRSELNFSEWGNYGERMKQTRLGALCELVQKGEMPLASYAMVHREVALSADEVKSICEWSAKERSRLALAHP